MKVAGPNTQVPGLLTGPPALILLSAKIVLNMGAGDNSWHPLFTYHFPKWEKDAPTASPPALSGVNPAYPNPAHRDRAAG
jgi:hypothetical protein